MKKLIIPFFLLLTFGLSACQGTENQKPFTVEESVMEVNMPFEDLVCNDVQEVKMFMEPLQTEVLLSDEQRNQLIGILNEVIIYEQISSQTLVGQMVQYQITKSDGNTFSLKTINPYIIIDDIWYKAKYEPCEELNQFANEIMNGLINRR